MLYSCRLPTWSDDDERTIFAMHTNITRTFFLFFPFHLLPFLGIPPIHFFAFRPSLVYQLVGFIGLFAHFSFCFFALPGARLFLSFGYFLLPFFPCFPAIRIQIQRYISPNPSCSRSNVPFFFISVFSQPTSELP